MKRDELEQLAMALGGLSILGCLPGSPAERAGLRYGDVLLEVNGTPTPNLDAYISAIRGRTESMNVRVFRDGVEQRFDLALDAAPREISPAVLLQRVMAAGVLPATSSCNMHEKEEGELLS